MNCLTLRGFEKRERERYLIKLLGKLKLFERKIPINPCALKKYAAAFSVSRQKWMKNVMLKDY